MDTNIKPIQPKPADWTQLKKLLVKKGVLDKIFITPISVSRREAAADKFEPLLISTQIDKLGDLIEKCMALRREIRELEVLAVKSIMDYELFIKTSAIDEEAEKIKLLRSAKEAEKQGEDSAATAFGTTAPLNSGFAAISEGRSVGLDHELTAGDRLAELIKARWSSVREYQASYYSRYKESGNAHNYTERVRNLKTIIEEEMSEAMDRAIALDVGLKSIYGWSPAPAPAKIDLVVLDAFVVWVLKARRGVNSRSERETSFDITVPLVQPWSNKAHGIINRDVFDQAIKSPTDQPILLRFDIDRSIFFDQDVRLKGFGLAFGNKCQILQTSGIDRIQTADGFARIAAIVATPEQTYSNGDKYKRPPIILGNIGPHQSGQPTAFVDGALIENICPVGSWEIRLHPWIVWKESDAKKISDGIEDENSRIRDLKIMFRVYLPALS
ncbi:hypothetical protein LMG24238_04500 [Paraburkholderia sediminicola]|uniref:Tc toxin complex TcA C-terminal TcB-binding domain-containing protein n=1 Tax=Paraburkholderia sediminicola TaxID=458836 RepID=A0A6J5BRC4_9BURK|nr:hypothetical protein [Paraburkholderia sediminicola]CAB3715751.1 hypothetical protein LMG24238_04500 [Paraburkholderia sediminicola]